jgi:hypothetical protein
MHVNVIPITAMISEDLTHRAAVRTRKKNIPFFHFFSGEKRFVFFLSANIYDAFMYLMAC